MNSLSKSGKKAKQLVWASIDSTSIRYLLAYVFQLVRTQGGNNSGGRYPALRELKAMVQTPAVKRRLSNVLLDASSIQRIADSFPSLQLADQASSAPSEPRTPSTPLMDTTPAESVTEANSAPSEPKPSSTPMMDTTPLECVAKSRTLAAHFSVGSSPEKATADPYMTELVGCASQAVCSASPLKLGSTGPPFLAQALETSQVALSSHCGRHAGLNADVGGSKLPTGSSMKSVKKPVARKRPAAAPSEPMVESTQLAASSEPMLELATVEPLSEPPIDACGKLISIGLDLGLEGWMLPSESATGTKSWVISEWPGKPLGMKRPTIQVGELRQSLRCVQWWM
jgi:hypothetical protein